MPKKDLNTLGSLLGDLWKELSPIVRICLFLGLALGCVVAYRLLAGSGGDASMRFATRMLIFLVLGLIAAGGFVGLVAGVLIELLLKSLRARKKGQQKRPEASKTTWHVGRKSAKRRES